MTVLDEFNNAYLHYTVSQRLFEDRCRQLTECRGSAEERQALVDETLRLAVIRSVDAVFNRGSLYAIVGRNGAGKTTLLELITGVLAEDFDGSITYDGHPIEEIDHYRIRSEKACIMIQNPADMDVRVSELMGDTFANTADMLEAARTMGMIGPVFPDELYLSMLWAKRYTGLSGGGRNRRFICLWYCLATGTSSFLTSLPAHSIQLLYSG